MRIAIEYDDAYSTDAGLWDSFIDDAKARGHEVICIAQREVSDPIAVAAAPAMLIHYIGGQNKHAYAKREGLRIDVWIDSEPSASR